MWAYESVLYQIYPLGFCGAPYENDGVQTHKILKVIDWIPHLTKLGIDAVLFNPLFESDTHGYNTRDFKNVDVRLGTNKDFAKVCKALHKAGIRIILDGVFNHVGRGHAFFQDVVKNREASPYKDFFHINFGGNSNYNDGLWYEGWEGNFDLVKLNLANPAVSDYLMEAVHFWIDEFDIDGLRLDVAYCLDRNFIGRLRHETSSRKPDFFLVGEMIHGDYHQVMGEGLCHAATNYECYKGLHSSMNSHNLFEITHSLLRQFGPEGWTLYKGEHLLSFVDNHDVSRIATILQNKEHIKAIYTMMFGMPGIPTIYYGSEWGAEGDKANGDPSLRPCFEKPEWNDITEHLAGLIHGYHRSKALAYGDFKQVVLTNNQCVLERRMGDEDRALICLNIEGSDYTAHFDAGCGCAFDLATGERIDFGGGLHLKPYAAYLLQTEPFYKEGEEKAVPEPVEGTKEEQPKETVPEPVEGTKDEQPKETVPEPVEGTRDKQPGPQEIPEGAERIRIRYFNDKLTKLDYINGVSDWIDLRCAEDIDLKEGEFKLIPLGIAMELPEGYEAHVVPRSSTFKKYGVIQTNHMGVIDNSYNGDDDQWYTPVLAMRDTHIGFDERVFQFRIVKNQPPIVFEETDRLGGKSRGGFGSTGND